MEKSTLSAFVLCLSVFALWAFTGAAVLRLLDPTRNRLQRLLLAPPIGLITTLVPLFLLSRWGVPVRPVGPWVTLFLFTLSIAGVVLALRDRKRRAPLGTVIRGRYWPFAVVLLVGAFLACRPMFTFGFDWLSFCNDDMANYCMAAVRFLQYGMFDLPTIESLGGGLDYTQNFWFMHARDGQRPGCELLLAWACANTGLSPHAVFMPVIMAMHLSLVSATAGALMRGRRRHEVALVAALLMAMTALSTFGAIYQLIAQVSGLGILIVSVTLILRPYHTMSRRVAMRYALACALVLTGFLINYPELTPFLVLAFVCHQGVHVVRRRKWPSRRMVVIAAIAVGVGSLLMGAYTYNALRFMLRQASLGDLHTDVFIKLFPFYLMPSGLANAWNMQAVAFLRVEPAQSIFIGVTIAMTLAAVVACVRQSWRGEPMAIVLLVMIVMAVKLFAGTQAFGLYKIAMFVQPFLMAVVAIALVWPGRFARTRGALLVAYLAVAVTVQWFYVRQSFGDSGFAEIRDASNTRLASRFERLVKDVKPTSLVIDTSNIALAKFQMVYTVGIETAVPSHDYFETIQKIPTENAPLSAPGVSRRGDELLDAVARGKRQEHFDLKRRASATFPATAPAYRDALDPGPRGLEARNAFVAIATGSVNGNPINNDYFAAAGGALSILNRFHNDVEDREHPFIFTKMTDVRDALLFKFSELGVPFGPYLIAMRDDDRVSFFQVEGDSMVPGGQMIGIGRYLLFEALRPSDGARLMLEITSTLKSDGSNKLPAVDAIGETREAMATVGRGAARVFSPPLKPQVIGGRNYYMLDMNEFGTYFPSPRSGLMKLWGKSVSYDRRRLVAFARDISLVGPTDYTALQAPPSVSTFPQDLLPKNLEYSGIYEKDGWVSEHSYFMLDPGGRQKLIVRGVIPDFRAVMPVVGPEPFTTTLTVLVDGQPVAEKTLPYGDFALEAPIPTGTGRRKVELRFNRGQVLPAGDDRPVGARLKFVGFE